MRQRTELRRARVAQCMQQRRVLEAVDFELLVLVDLRVAALQQHLQEVESRHRHHEQIVRASLRQHLRRSSLDEQLQAGEVVALDGVEDGRAFVERRAVDVRAATNEEVEDVLFPEQRRQQRGRLFSFRRTQVDFVLVADEKFDQV